MNSILECIEYSAAADNAVTSVFAYLRTIGSECSSGDEFMKRCRESEDEWCSQYHSDNPDAKKSNGDWKYRTLLPVSYSSAKSVIGKSLNAGIALENKSKSQLEKEYKSFLDVETQGTPLSTVSNAVTIIDKHYPFLTTAEKSAVAIALFSIIKEEL